MASSQSRCLNRRNLLYDCILIGVLVEEEGSSVNFFWMEENFEPVFSGRMPIRLQNKLGWSSCPAHMLKLDRSSEENADLGGETYNVAYFILVMLIALSIEHSIGRMHFAQQQKYSLKPEKIQAKPSTFRNQLIHFLMFFLISSLSDTFRNELHASLKN